MQLSEIIRKSKEGAFTIENITKLYRGAKSIVEAIPDSVINDFLAQEGILIDINIYERYIQLWNSSERLQKFAIPYSHKNCLFQIFAVRAIGFSLIDERFILYFSTKLSESHLKKLELFNPNEFILKGATLSIPLKFFE